VRRNTRLDRARRNSCGARTRLPESRDAPAITESCGAHRLPIAPNPLLGTKVSAGTGVVCAAHGPVS